MADRGIRVNVNHKFVELLAERATVGNTRFRANVIGYAMEEFGITLASAATHYNHAFKEAKKRPELAEALLGLGRPEDKKGGRKPKAKAPAAVATPILLLGYTPATVVAEAPEQTEFVVKRKSDGVVVAEGLTFENAAALVAKAAAAKKAKLYFA
jgi:hypothetical protein